MCGGHRNIREQLADRCSQVGLMVVSNHITIASAQIKEWIQLMVPKIEDGNNFGVSVQVSIIRHCGITDTALTPSCSPHSLG